jgi:hypothetical protein
MAGAHDHPVGRVPFWVHQVVELLLGILLLVQGARTGEHTAVLVTLGGLLLLLTLCSEGALSAWPVIGRRLHRVFDLVAVVVLAVSPLALGLDHVLAIVILELAAGAMLWLALRTAWPTRAAPPVPSATPPAPEPTPASPTSAPATSRSNASGANASGSAVPLARKVGAAVGKARDDGPRQLGRLVGRAQRAAKAAMAPDPPAPQPPERPAPSEPPAESPPSP